jgi:stage V sporulation protein B
LAAAALIARFLGVIQRVPLDHFLGPVGGASYGIANNVYMLLLTVATAGIPSTLSKMVSEKTALGQYEEARRIYRAAFLFGLAGGLFVTALLFIAAPYYARYVSKIPEAALSIRAIAPALLLFPAIAMMRGYFQGRQMMAAGGISQIVEQILRVATAVLLAFVMATLGASDERVAAGASFGGVLGAIGAFAVMLYYSRNLKRADAMAKRQRVVPSFRRRPQQTYSEIYAEMFRTAIPIVLTSIAVPLIYFIDSSIVVQLLERSIGADAATQALNVLTIRAQSIAGIPPILAIALSQSVIPVISSSYARKDMTAVAGQATLAIRISILSGVPIVLALVTAAQPVNGLLFSDLDGTGIIAVLTAGTIFQITMLTTGSILTGLGRPKVPMANVFVGVFVKLAGSYALAPFFGIYGIIAATGLCFLVTTLLNVMALRRRFSFAVLGRRWPGFLLAVAVSGGAGYALGKWGIGLASVLPDRLVYLIVASAVGGAVLLLFALLLVLCNVIGPDDLRSYPRPVRKAMSVLFRLLGKTADA